MTFKDLNISPSILKVLETKAYGEPTEIQQKAIPLIQEGKDILGIAQTGTGKTAAFALPILSDICKEPRKTEEKNYVQALIIVPTRELAVQIGENIEKYAEETDVQTGVVFGGITPKRHIKVLKREPSILVATPGRLLDLIGKGATDFSRLKYLVLDEADRMLDLGMITDVRKIIDVLPQKRQNMLFSATMAIPIRRLVYTMLVDPVSIEVESIKQPKKDIEQRLYHVEETEKTKLLLHFLDENDYDSVIIFVRTKKKADKVAKVINATHVRTKAIHGDKNQIERTNSIDLFKSGEVKILVATDVASRGLDISKVTYVINMNIPNVAETYVHRIGRTGRAGNTGIAVSFCSSNEREFLRDIERLQQSRINVIDEHPFK